MKFSWYMETINRKCVSCNEKETGITVEIGDEWFPICLECIKDFVSSTIFAFK